MGVVGWRVTGASVPLIERDQNISSTLGLVECVSSRIPTLLRGLREADPRFLLRSDSCYDIPGMASLRMVALGPVAPEAPSNYSFSLMSYTLALTESLEISRGSLISDVFPFILNRCFFSSLSLPLHYL